MSVIIDMINLDHAYLYYQSKMSSRKGNIRPYIRTNQVIINDDITCPLITQHTNSTLFTFEAWLATYIQHYFNEMKIENIDRQHVMFIAPHYFNIKSIEVAMKILNIQKWSWMYDYYAAAYHVSQKAHKNCWVIVPSEFETTIAKVDIDGHIIDHVKVLSYGSYFIKRRIQQYVSQYTKEISVDDAWEIYKMLQMSDEIDVANVILSVDKSLVITQADLEQILAEYYTKIKRSIPNDVPVAPFRWIGRDRFIQHVCNDIITVYNPDEGICLGAASFITTEDNFEVIDNFIYRDFNIISTAYDYHYLNSLIQLSDEFNSFVNMVDKAYIALNMPTPPIELTEESLMRLKEDLKDPDLVECADVLLTKLRSIFIKNSNSFKLP